MVKMKVRALVMLAFAMAGLALMAERECLAASITLPPGYDLTQTSTAYLNYNTNPTPPPDAYVLIPFTGNPLGTFAFPGVDPSPTYVGFTDTIIHRSGPVTLTFPGVPQSVPIEVVALSLKTTFMGMDLYATLNGTPSVGTMDIVYDGSSGGSWTNDFTVNLDIHIGSLTGPIFDTVSKHFTGHGEWSTTPGPFYSDLIIPEVNKDGNFWLLGPALHDDGSDSEHVVKDVTHAPEPSSAVLIVSGLLITGFYKFRCLRSRV